MRTVVVLTFLVALAAPSSGFMLVGEDATGDGSHYVLDVADVGDTISPTRTDITGLDVLEGEDTVSFRLRTAALTAGTGGYMFHVSFQRGENLYWTCWAVQWIGGQISEENLKGCSRFTEGTQVGPEVTGPTNLDATGVFAESAAGIEVGEVDGQAYIMWPVPMSEIGGGLAGLSDFSADTWFRGGTLDYAGSTTDSQYHWAASDVGPDEGVWMLPDLAPPVVPSLNLSAPDDLRVMAGSATQIPIEVRSSSSNVTFTLEAPESWNATVEWVDAVVNGTGSAVVRLTAPTAGNRTYSLTLSATAGDLEATLPISMFVEALDTTPVVDDNSTGLPDVTADAKDTPGPATALMLLALGVAAFVARRK